MDKKDYDILLPVNSKNVFGRILWILGSFLSIFLLIFSCFFENAILVILDGLMPLAFFIYRLIKKKEYPFYYYLICSCGLYFLFWVIFLSPEFVGEVADESSCGFLELILIGFIFFMLIVLIYKSTTKYTFGLKNNEKLGEVFIYIETLFIVVFIIGAEVLTLNVALDKPYKEETVYITDTIPSKTSTRIYYKHSLNDETENSILFKDGGLDLFYAEEMATIEYGKGAFGLEWRRIVK